MIIKVIALAFIGVFVGLFLKKYNKELIPFFEIAIVFSVLIMIKEEFSSYEGKIESLLRLYPQGESLFGCLFKGAALTVITKLVSEICKESGNAVMSELVELGGRIMLLILTLPFIIDVAETALSFIG